MTEWISVEDSLPKDCYSTRFLAYGIPGCGSCREKIQIQFCRYYEGVFEFGEYDCDFEATHWMPLPTPPDNK